MYLPEKVTHHETKAEFWIIRVRYLQKCDGGPWPTFPHFETEDEAKAFAAILRCAHADGVRSMKEAMREMFDLAAVDHEHDD